MILKHVINLVIFFVITLFTLQSCHQKQDKKLLIATAANVQFAMDELVTAFTNKTGIACEIVLSSSGKLTAQIKEGAPYDVFVSANMKYPNELYKTGFTENKPAIYAYGKLVLLSLLDDIPVTIESLKIENVKHIALANPKTAPYGVSTVEVLKAYKIYDEVKEKLVFGESISQTNQFILSKAAEIGFTAKSVVKSPKMNGLGKWIAIPDNTYQPIAQGVVVIKNKNKEVTNAMSFYKFLFSQEAKNILVKHGYDLN